VRSPEASLPVAATLCSEGGFALHHMLEDLHPLLPPRTPLELRLVRVWEAGAGAGDGEFEPVPGAPGELEETAEAFIVQVDLAGSPPDAVGLRFRGQTLDVLSSDPRPRAVGPGLAPPGPGHRHRVAFPAEVVPEQAVARLEDGVLRIVVPKAHPASARRAALG
jgi:HSP20 family molecular chaperone IbpA